MSGDHTPRLDRKLGADRRIPRRDFLQGTLIGAATALNGPLLAGLADAASQSAAPSAAQDQPGYYPPLLTGLRGSHPGSFEAAHALRDGSSTPSATDTGENYDLVVVGGGISGLAAARFFQARSSRRSRILILDNHDDFGGHAKRNEFTLGGRVQLLNGGTLEIDSPRPYSAVADGLLRELGIDISALSRKVEHRGFYRAHGLQDGAFFDAETFGADKLVVGVGRVPVRTLLKDAPLTPRARADIARIEEGALDYLPGTTPGEKKLRLSRISYRDFLRDLVRADPVVLAYYQARTEGWWGVGIDAVSALDCWAFGYPGFKGMKLPRGSIARMGPTPAGYLDTGGSDVVFADAPRVTPYAADWRYVLVSAGQEQAARWRSTDPWKGCLPDLMFPADRSWLASTLWDDDWTCIGGPAELVDSFLRHPGLQARPVALGQDATPPGHQAR